VKRELPDLGPVTAEYRELFEQSAQQKLKILAGIEHYAHKPTPSVRDRLLLAFFQNELSFVEPTDLVPGMSLWEYWVENEEHQERLRKYMARGHAIVSYLFSPGELTASQRRAQRIQEELVAQSDLNFMALYPLLKTSSNARRGRPVDRRPSAVRALQLKIDHSWTWKRIATQLCDCGKPLHDSSCAERIRQSSLALQKLLRECGVIT